MRPQAVEPLVEIGSGEELAERVEDVARGLTGTVPPTELGTENGRIQQRGLHGSGGRERCGLIDGGDTGGVDDAGPESDRGPMALPDPPHTHHEPQATRRRARLVGVGDHARVAQRRAFDGVFVREGGSQQQHSLFAEFAAGVEPVGELVGVPAERVPQTAMPAAEPRHDVVQGLRGPRRRSARGCAASTAPARDSCSSKPSCPGTNSRAITRAGSAARRCGLRVTSWPRVDVIAGQAKTGAPAAWSIARPGWIPRPG